MEHQQRQPWNKGTVRSLPGQRQLAGWRYGRNGSMPAMARVMIGGATCERVEGRLIVNGACSFVCHALCYARI